MSEPLRVDPHALAVSGKDTIDHAHDAHQALSAHDNGIAEARSRWVGSSASALSELAERWQARHVAHLEQTRSLGENMATAALSYVVTDDDSGESVTRAACSISPDQMGL
ncbi:WXG100 family type VII secretion target [Mycobacterium sp. DL440]|uniref:WXG100 family type VII secretion target n=1 Tax=Mycobacterium sp. DL440 TaxID=2675523 RepID=UPI00141DF980|nr:WXG100 family type VII secretion target [Mycobacterium sp. DL440]